MHHKARLTMLYLLVPVLLFLCMSIPGSSSDAKGNYVALGFGLEPCQTFLQARSNHLDLPYRHWRSGYLTAVNKLTKDTPTVSLLLTPVASRNLLLLQSLPDSIRLCTKSVP